MSDPVVYKDPSSGNIMEVVEAKPVSADEIDSRINEVNNHIAELQHKVQSLNALKTKVQSFDQPAPAPDPTPTAEQPSPADAMPSATSPANAMPLEMTQTPPISA